MKQHKEPAVITMHMITSALEVLDDEQAQLLNPGSKVARPPVSLEASETLRLSFRGLVRIQNLDCLKGLRKLQLDNNGIKRIEGLGCLAGTLEWLDLSFNALESMEGLGSLPRLADLTLFHNSIKVATGLEGCSALQCLSLGENKFDGLLDTVLYLRRLPALEVLTLEGNPLCAQGEGGRDLYRPHFLAFCTRLKYLDYQLITQTERDAAREGGVPSERLAEVEEADAAQAEVVAKERAKAAQLADYLAANLEVIETIFGDMFDGEENNADWMKLKHIPTMPHSLLALRESIDPLCTALRVDGMEKNARINEEMSQFQEALGELKEEVEAKAVARMAKWEASFKEKRGAHKAALASALEMMPMGERTAALANPTSTSPVTASALSALELELDAHVKQVIQEELAMHEAVESMLDVFDTSLGDLKASKLQLQETFFRGVEAAEGKFTELCVKEGDSVLAMGASNTLPAEMDDELKIIALDKELMAGALAGAHETRVARVLAREAGLKAREEKRCSGAVAVARSEEMRRNRERVVELLALGTAYKGRVAKAFKGEEGALLSTGGGVRDPRG